MSGNIEPLPDATRSRLRSTQLLVSLPQIVSELVQNSLDAGATQLDVALDADGWSCTVRDNGCGVPRASLASVSQRYNTSKTYSPLQTSSKTFGFRGEALASVADVCVLELSTRTKQDADCWSIIAKGGDQIHCGPALRNSVSGPNGTVVCVRDAFYNLPVRRLSHPNPAKTLEIVRREMEMYALSCPHVGFSLQNTSIVAGRGRTGGKMFTVPKTMSTLATFRRLYGRALAEHVDEINVGAENMRLKGFISLDGAPSRSHQFLCEWKPEPPLTLLEIHTEADVNHHPVYSSELSRTIDAAFATSTFAKHAFEESGKYTPERPHQRRSPRKMEKYPVYVLDLILANGSMDNCLDPSKSTLQFKELGKLSEFLSSAIKAFLERHGFRAAKLSRQDVEDGDGSPRKKRRIDGGGKETASRPQAPFVTPKKPTMSLKRPDRPLKDDEMEWTDPNTGAVHILDKRTGTSVLQSRDDDAETSTTAGSAQSIVDTRSLRKREKERLRGQDEPAMPAWMRDVFEKSENPIFRKPKECGIASIIPAVASVGSSKSKSCCPHLPPSHSHTTIETSFTRDDLRTARVLGQVDRKFVACVMAGTLVLIDQHAADERIRVERFLAQLCGDPRELETVELELEAGGPSGVPVLLTMREADLLARKDAYRAAFARWGIGLDVPEARDWESGGDHAAGKPEYVQVWVRSVPELVADKLVQDNELRDLIKGYLVTLEIDGIPPPRQPGASWNAVLQHFPRQLVEIVNSKACRGAIMFNDNLDLDRCVRLVSELSDTLFPFQCAHGRPSLTPLASLDSVSQPSEVAPDWSSFICSIDALDVE